MKKILIVVESLDVDDSSGAKGRVALIKNLQKAGYQLQVYHYTLKPVELHGIPTFAIQENRRSVLFYLSRAERYIRDYGKIKIYKPIQQTFGFSFALFNDRNSIVKALKEIDFNPDLILTLSKGGSFRPHHALLKIPEWHSKWIAYIHDPYPMHHYPRPYTWVEPGYKKKEKFIRNISEKAAYSAFPSQLLMEWMGEFYPGFLKNGIILPHQIDEINTYLKDLPPFFDQKKFNLLHAGYLLKARRPQTLIKAYKRFLNNFLEASDHTRLIFLGGNNREVEKISQNNSNIYISKEYIKFEEVLNIQMKASVNIIIEAKGHISPFLPGKFPHCIQAGVPILLLGPPKSESRRLLGEKYKYWSEIDDEETIYQHIVELFKLWKKDPHNFIMDYSELKEYLSYIRLKKVFDDILMKN